MMPRRKKDFRPFIFVFVILAVVLGAYMMTLHDWGGAIDWEERGREVVGSLAFIIMIGFCFYGLKNIRSQPRGESRIVGTIFIFFFMGILFSLFVGYLGTLISAEATDIANTQIVVMFFSILIGVITAFVDH